MDAGQDCGGGRFGQNKFWLSGNGRQFQCAFLEFNLLPFQNEDGNPAEKEKCGWNHGELIGGAHEHGGNLGHHRQMDENEYHEAIKNPREHGAYEKGESVIHAGIATAFESKTVFDVALCPGENIRLFAGRFWYKSEERRVGKECRSRWS